MANNYRFPGVYASINDLSGIVNINATTSCAYVGQAEFGPVLKPTLVTSLSEFVSRFGSLNSKYGYAGYSLAVASETIPEHRFVRVVPVGDPTKEEHERKNDAKWAAGSIKLDGLEKEDPEDESTSHPDPHDLGFGGYFYEIIDAAENSRDAGSPTGLFNTTDYEDVETAMIFAATDPNGRRFRVTTADSTINVNKTYAIQNVELEQIENDSKKYIVTLTVEDINILKDVTEGGKIAVKRMSNSGLNGTFVLTSVKQSEGAVELEFIASLNLNNDERILFNNARVGAYPEDKDTTFSVTVEEVFGTSRVVLETFEFCTLFPAKDSYGNSMFVEDVINGYSKYIQVFANTNILEGEDYVRPANKSIELTGGNSGKWEDPSDMYKDLCNAWELFRDRSQVPASILMNCGYVTKNDVSYQEKMLEIAEYRRDCFCLFDVPMTETEYEHLIDWRDSKQAFDSYRGANCGPWVKAYDSVQGRSNFMMCPSAYVAKLMGTNDPWLAPAGLNRGVLSSSIVSPTGLSQYYNDTQGGNLYTDEQINCIIRDPSVGYVNWGQRTLQRKSSSMDRINVARTVIYIETILRDAARFHLFENNTAYERTQITLQFNSFLNSILSAEGIQRFVVQCDGENNPPSVVERNQLVIDVYLWPSYCAEVICLNVNVEGADISVQLSSK